MAGKKLRSPFVTTASYVTAALTLVGCGVGCGGRVLGSGGDGDAGLSPEDSNGSEVVASEVGPSPGCPATPPRERTCSSEGTSCDYSRCYAPYWESGEFAYCKGGEWHSGASSCNPPPPPPQAECPLTIAFGSACTHPSWQVCDAVISCAYDRTATIIDTFRCLDGRWISADGYHQPPPCPVVPPQHGSSCACGTKLTAAKCNYGNCYGSPTTYASCDPGTKIWSVSQQSCNPPPPSYDGGYYPPDAPPYNPPYDAGYYPSDETGPSFDANRAE